MSVIDEWFNDGHFIYTYTYISPRRLSIQIYGNKCIKDIRYPNRNNRWGITIHRKGGRYGLEENIRETQSKTDT